MMRTMKPRIDEIVYFVVFPESDRVKIGLTTVLGFPKRLAAMKTMRAGETFYVLKIVRGCRALERSLHRLFRAFRIGGEWYRFSPIEMYLASIPAMTPDEQLGLPFSASAPA